MSDARPIHDIVAALGGVRSLAEICGVPLNTAAAWRRRGAIPGRYWAAITASPPAHAEGVTLDGLAALHAPVSTKRDDGAGGAHDDGS